MIVAIAHHAGGVGKTTTALNLAHALAVRDRRVLVVDLDPQADLTGRLQIDPALSTLARVLTEGEGTPAVVPTGTFALIPSNLETMAGLEMALTAIQQREQRLRWSLADLRSHYDYILLDCPPNLSLLATNALYAADAVLIPVQAQDKAVRLLNALHDTIALVRRYRQRESGAAVPVILGYLLTMVARTTQSREAEADLRTTYGAQVFTATIPQRTELQADSRWGTAIGVYAPQSAAALAYPELAQEIATHAP